MPKVGGKEFPYTKKGIAAAKKAEKGLYARSEARALLPPKTLRIQPRQQRVVRGSNGNI
jgi:hypothetical protein